MIEIDARKKSLNIKERVELKRIISGELDVNTIKAQELLNRPHVAITFEALLDKHRLSDDVLLKRLAEIVKRKATESISDKGIKSTNITAIDANAKETARLIWQMQGRFIDKHEFKGELSNVDDKELDEMLTFGMRFLQHKGKVPIDHGTDTSTS